MRLWIIRHAKVDQTWPIFCSSSEFDKDCANVTHDFFMVTLVRKLKVHGFSVQNRSARYVNLAVVEAERDT